MSKLNTLQLNGYLTISKSKSFSSEEKERIMAAAPGKAKAIRVMLVDDQGNTLSWTCPLYESQNHSLTARLNAKIDNFEIVEVDDPKTKKQEKSEAAAKDLIAEFGLSTD